MPELPLIPIMRPWMDEREARAAARPISSGWVTQGPEVAAFEKEFGDAVGAAHACAVSNCTTALHLALLAAGVQPGDEVVTVSHSFIATANAIRYCGAIPIFVDVDPRTFNMLPDRIERVATERARAILCVHQIGMPCDLAAISEIARRRGLPLIEDAACAIGSEILWNGEWERIGKPHGDVACFSFHPRKIVTTGDGGMLTTSRAEWDQRFRLWRQHGMSVPDTVRHGSREVIFESYPELGFNYRMTDLQAAIGREQLRRLPEMVARRRELAARYAAMIERDAPEIATPLEPEWARGNWQSYCVGLPAGCDQKRVMQAMLDAGVSSRRGVMCSHREKAYAEQPWSCGSPPDCCPPGQCCNLANSERAQDASVILPLYHQMTDAEQERVVAALASGVRESRAVSAGS